MTKSARISGRLIQKQLDIYRDNLSKYRRWISVMRYNIHIHMDFIIAQVLLFENAVSYFDAADYAPLATARECEVSSIYYQFLPLARLISCATDTILLHNMAITPDAYGVAAGHFASSASHAALLPVTSLIHIFHIIGERRLLRLHDDTVIALVTLRPYGLAERN